MPRLTTPLERLGIEEFLARLSIIAISVSFRDFLMDYCSFIKLLDVYGKV
jgi:hypothetical protein